MKKYYNLRIQNYNIDIDQSIINNLGFYYIDLNSDFFSKTSNPEKFFTGSYRSHFTIEGYKKISIFISNNLNYD